MTTERLGRRSLTLDLGLGVLLAGGGFADGLSPSSFPRPSLAIGALMALAGAAQAFRRLRPMASFTASFVAMGAVAILAGHYESGSSLLIALVATYSVVVYGSNLPFALAVLVAFAATLNLGQTLGEAVTDMVFTLIFMGLAVGAGLGVRAFRDRASSATARAAALERERAAAAVAAAEAERIQLARELHDILAHGLGVIVLQAGAAEHALSADPSRARAAIESIRATANDAIGELLALVRAVRADVTKSREPQPTLADLPGLAERATRAGFAVNLTVNGPPRAVPAAVQASVYRVAQEGLANAMKHSGGRACQLVLRYLDDDVRIEVLDEGTTPSHGSGSRLGLVGIQERVGVFGGTMHAGPREGGGWELVAAFPSAR